MKRLPLICTISRRHLYFLRYSSKDASSSNDPHPKAAKTPAKIPKKESQILAEERKDYIQVIDPAEMPRTQRAIAERFVQQNKERSFAHMRAKKRNIQSISFWILLALFIYFYTMNTIKQETFLEEIDDELASKLGTETEEQYRKRRAEEIRQERGFFASVLYKWGFLET